MANRTVTTDHPALGLRVEFSPVSLIHKIFRGEHEIAYAFRNAPEWSVTLFDGYADRTFDNMQDALAFAATL